MSGDRVELEGGFQVTHAMIVLIVEFRHHVADEGIVALDFAQTSYFGSKTGF